MAKYDTYGAEAERLFVEKGMSLTQIAKILPISAQTLVAWRKRYNWDKKRARFLTQPTSITDRLRDLLELRLKKLFEKMDQGEEVTDAEIDGITKLVASIKKIDKEVDLTATAPMVMKEFATFLIQKSHEEEQFSEVKEIFKELIPDFMDYLWKKYRR